MNEETIFANALEKPADARAAYLAEACGNDEALRKRLEALLAASDKVGNFMAKPAAAPAVDPVATQALPAPADCGAPATDSAEEPLTFLTPSARPDSLGRLGHYEVLQVLGRGGFGIVFRAFDEVLQRVVALKVLAPAIAATSPARRRFLREARSSAQVRHENVVHVYEVVEQPLPYLVMEFIPGETLQQKLDRVGPLDVPETVHIGRQIAEGLAAAHATDLIHRDIKPGNVLLEGGHHKVKITDFGLARAADDASISQSGIIAGTPMYMAPEQAEGNTLDQRADLFSLGSVLYQMVAGRPPFRANTTVAVLKRVAEDKPRAIREIIPETPQWLCDIIAKLHAKNPDERFQSAREVADILAECEAQFKANAKVSGAYRFPSSKPAPAQSGAWKWVAAAMAVLLPVIALAVTEFTGVTHLFLGQAPLDPGKPGGDPPRIVVANKETPVPVAKPELLPPTFKNSIGMEFVIVPKGKSWLGGSKDKPGNKEVEIPADFYLGKYEVTQEEWEKVMSENPSQFSRTGGGKDAVKDVSDADLKRFPVEFVSWDHCQVFVARLNALEKEAGWAYRLPKLTEWEYACRGGPMADKADSAFDYYLANPTNTLLATQANIGMDSQLNRPCKVGTYEPNRLGLFDMHGNVWEWCHDEILNPIENRTRAHRGGSYRGGKGDYPKAGRLFEVPPTRLATNVGLRLARVASGVPSPVAKTPPLAVAPFADADVQRIAALPAAEQVEEVRKELMRRNPGFDGKFGHKIEGGMVTEFRIVTDQVTDIAPIRVFDALRVLECRSTWTGKPNGLLADLTPLAGMNLARLTSLGLQNTQVTDAGMVYFKDCKNLTELRLSSTQVSDVGLAHFKNCENLLRLSLDYTQVSDAGLAHFKDCKALTRLYLQDTKVSDAGLTHFKGISLRVLWIRNTGITDLTPLQGMPLEQILLTPKNITRGLDILRDMKSLKTIGIDHKPAWPAAEFWERYDKGEFTKASDDKDPDRRAAEYVLSIGGTVRVDGNDREIRAPGDLPAGAFRLTHVSLIRNKQVTDSGLAAFKDCKNLTYLNLYGCVQITDAGLAHFKDCRNLSVLRLESVPVTDVALAVFAGYENLTNLQLGNNTRVTDAGLAYLKDCKKLTVIHFMNMPVTDTGLAHLKDCKNVTLLDLRGTKVTDMGLAYFKDCKDLSELWLGGTSITDAGLALFEHWKNLKNLELPGTSITDAGLAHLKDHKKLERLRLDGTPVTDAGLAHLAGQNRLTELTLNGTKVTGAGLAHFKGTPLKVLRIDNTGITDLTPLQGMPLEDIRLTPKNITQGLDILRDMKSLKTIGIRWQQGWPAAEFWERYDKGEFKE